MLTASPTASSASAAGIRWVTSVSPRSDCSGNPINTATADASRPALRFDFIAPLRPKMERLLAHATRNYFETDDPLVRRRKDENRCSLNQQPATPAIIECSHTKPQNSVFKRCGGTFWLRTQCPSDRC